MVFVAVSYQLGIHISEQEGNWEKKRDYINRVKGGVVFSDDLKIYFHLFKWGTK